MASSRAPLIQVLKADAAIGKGKAVKIGTDNQHVAVAAATTDEVIGIAQNAAVNAGDKVEVACVGGGAKALAQTTIGAGQLLVPHTDGSLKKISAANDRYIAVAKQSAVAGDLFDVDVVIGQGTATEV